MHNVHFDLHQLSIIRLITERLSSYDDEYGSSELLSDLKTKLINDVSNEVDEWDFELAMEATGDDGDYGYVTKDDVLEANHKTEDYYHASL